MSENQAEQGVTPPPSLDSPGVNSAPETFSPDFTPRFGADTQAPVSSDIPSVVPVSAVVGATPLVTPMNTPPVKKSKKGLIIGLIVGAVVILGLASAASVYAFVYNNPQNAVNDALAKSLFVKSGTMEGTVSAKSDAVSVTADITFAANNAKQSSMDMAMSIKSSGNDIGLKGHMVTTEDSYYMKMDDLRSAVSDMYGKEYMSIIDGYYGDLMDKIDNKWIGLSFSDIESLTDGAMKKDDLTCTQNVFNKLTTDAAIRDEVMSAYTKNPLFTVESKGSDANGNHYQLVPVSNADARKFAAALVETKFFAQLDDCSSEDYKKMFTEDFASGDSTSSKDAKGTIDLWIDGWSHDIKKMTLAVQGDGTDVKVDLTFKLNTNPSVTVPKAETTVDDIKAEIKKLEESFMVDDTSSNTDTSSSLYDFSSNVDYGMNL